MADFVFIRRVLSSKRINQWSQIHIRETYRTHEISFSSINMGMFQQLGYVESAGLPLKFYK